MASKLATALSSIVVSFSVLHRPWPISLWLLTTSLCHISQRVVKEQSSISIYPHFSIIDLDINSMPLVGTYPDNFKFPVNKIPAWE